MSLGDRKGQWLCTFIWNIIWMLARLAFVECLGFFQATLNYTLLSSNGLTLIIYPVVVFQLHTNDLVNMLWLLMTWFCVQNNASLFIGGTPFPFGIVKIRSQPLCNTRWSEQLNARIWRTYHTIGYFGMQCINLYLNKYFSFIHLYTTRWLSLFFDSIHELQYQDKLTENVCFRYDQPLLSITLPLRLTHAHYTKSHSIIVHELTTAKQ